MCASARPGIQPLKPLANDAAGLHTTATGIKVGLSDDAGADEIAQQAQNILMSVLSFHA